MKVGDTTGREGSTDRQERQARLDRIAFDMYVDCYFNYAEAARQLGIARTTVRARVRRASLRSGGNIYSTNSVGV